MAVDRPHLASVDAYRAFYNEAAPERPWTPIEQVPHMHQVMPRWGVVHQQIQWWGHRRVVDLGCMDGFNLLNLALTTPHVQCVGVDVNEAAIAEARQRAARLGVADRVRFDVSMAEDAADVLPAHAFDAVLALELLEHVVEPDPVLDACDRLLAPGGRVYLSAPMTEPPHASDDDREAQEHVRLLDSDTFHGLLVGASGSWTGANGWRSSARLVWYTQLPSPGWIHQCGAYEVTG